MSTTFHNRMRSTVAVGAMLLPIAAFAHIVTDGSWMWQSVSGALNAPASD